MYQDKKNLATQGFLRAFQPSFSCNEKFTPKPQNVAKNVAEMSPKTRTLKPLWL